jgi:FixJ family two-component response regulator
MSAPLRCAHCGAKTKDGKLARLGIAAVRARLAAGDGYKQIAYDLGISESAVARWCRTRAIGSKLSKINRVQK